MPLKSYNLHKFEGRFLLKLKPNFNCFWFHPKYVSYLFFGNEKQLSFDVRSKAQWFTYEQANQLAQEYKQLMIVKRSKNGY